jgi:hypothetical protein
MKPIYVLMIAIATGLVGTGIGWWLGAKFFGKLGFAGGVNYGVCVTTETAKQDGILTQAEIARLLGQIKKTASSDFNLKPEQVEEFAQLNCQDIRQKAKSN